MNDLIGRIDTNIKGLAALAVAGALLTVAVFAGNPAVNTSLASSVPTHESAVDQLYYAQQVSVTASSQTLAAIIATALNDDAIKIQIVNRHASTAIHFAVGEAATTSHPRLAAGENLTLRATKADMDTLRWISASGTVTADLLIWKLRQAGGE